MESLSRAKYQKPIERTILIWKRANMEEMDFLEVDAMETMV
jgi:hypothetical protein